MAVCRNRSGALGRDGSVEGRREHVVDRVGEDEVELGARFIGQFLEIRLVLAGQDDALDPGALRDESLLADAADRQHLAGQGYLAGHRDVVRDRDTADERHDRGRHGDPR